MNEAIEMLNAIRSAELTEGRRFRPAGSVDVVHHSVNGPDCDLEQSVDPRVTANFPGDRWLPADESLRSHRQLLPRAGSALRSYSISPQ